MCPVTVQLVGDNIERNLVTPEEVMAIISLFKERALPFPTL